MRSRLLRMLLLLLLLPLLPLLLLLLLLRVLLPLVLLLLVMEISHACFNGHACVRADHQGCRAANACWLYKALPQRAAWPTVSRSSLKDRNRSQATDPQNAVFPHKLTLSGTDLR
jgi:hypothetical protein